MKKNPKFFYNKNETLTIPCEIWRGGTSRAVFILEENLPHNPIARDLLIRRVIGSQDQTRVDGVGGTSTHTTKVAIISRSRRDDADIEFTIAQVSATKDIVDYSATCGNIASAVGPFAIANKLINSVNDGITKVKVYDKNTNTVFFVFVPIEDGCFVEEGNCFIAGIMLPAAEILVDFKGFIGSKTGTLLPTKHAVDEFILEKGDRIPITLCDAGTPCIFIETMQFLSLDKGLKIDDTNDQFIALTRELRGKAALMLGLTHDWQSADKETPIIPEVMFISKPRPDDTEADIEIQLLTMGKLHASIGGGAAICLAAASRISCSLVNRILSEKALLKDEITIKHPLGNMEVKVKCKFPTASDLPEFETLAFTRTARAIMKGEINISMLELEIKSTPSLKL